MSLRAAGAVSLASLGLALAAQFLLPAAPALACSAGPDFNPAAESDVVVAGRVASWQRIQLPAGVPHAYDPIAIEIDVDTVFKGNAGASITAVDANSYVEAQDLWLGASGACGAFDADPTGSYVILGLTYADDGATLRSNRLTTLFIGDAPAGTQYAEALARLNQALGITPPATGTGGLRDSHSSGSSPLITIATGGLAALGLLALSRNRSKA